jgi:hypothetical protein
MTTADETRLEQFMGEMVGHMTGRALCFGIWLGDELGLYRALSDAGPVTADDLAGKARCNGRLVREWLDGQVAGRLVGYDAEADRYQLAPDARGLRSGTLQPVPPGGRDPAQPHPRGQTVSQAAFGVGG